MMLRASITRARSSNADRASTLHARKQKINGFSKIVRRKTQKCPAILLVSSEYGIIINGFSWEPITLQQCMQREQPVKICRCFDRNQCCCHVMSNHSKNFLKFLFSTTKTGTEFTPTNCVITLLILAVPRKAATWTENKARTRC